MSGSVESAILVIASLVLAVFIAQTILMFLFFFAFRKWSERTSAQVKEISQTALPAIQALRELLEDSRKRFSSIGANLEEISTLTRNQVNRLNGMVSEASERAHVQIVRLDGLVSDTISKVEDTTAAIQRGVVRPVHEISAILTGIRVAIAFLRRRNRSTVDRATHDEEMFI